MPVAGAADRVREGTGQEGEGALQPPQEAPWGLVAEQHLPLALQTPCRLPARPPLVWAAPSGGPGCWAQAEALPLPLPQGSTTHSCARE